MSHVQLTVRGESLVFQKEEEQHHLSRLLTLMKKQILSLEFPGNMVLNLLRFMGLLVPLQLLSLQAYIPVPWLHSVGIFYCPSRCWALAVSTYAIVMIVLAIGFYTGLNFISTPSPASLNIMFDEFSREPSSFLSYIDGDEQPIEPISDLGISKINDLMFDDAK